MYPLGNVINEVLILASISIIWQ